MFNKTGKLIRILVEDVGIVRWDDEVKQLAIESDKELSEALIKIETHEAKQTQKVICDFPCKWNREDVCTLEILNIESLQYIEEKTSPKCFEIDTRKCDCCDCDYYSEDEDHIFCEADGFGISYDSKCTNGSFEISRS